MRVVEISESGGPEVLKIGERPLPLPGPDEVLIRVASAGLNGADMLQRKGNYPVPPGASDILGLEAAGTIVAVGPDVTGWEPGQKVCALLPGGGYAEYALAPAGHCLPVPDSLPLTEAGGLPETCFTVWSNVVMRGGLTAGDRFLTHGGASGIGTTAIQMAKLLGARVFATARSEEKCEICRQAGAERVILDGSEDFVEVLQAEGGADVILDMVAGDYFERNISALAMEGRLCHIASLGGSQVTLSIAAMMRKRLTVMGTTLRPQSDAAKTAIAEDLLARAWPWVADGRLRPVITAEFPLEQAAEAHAAFQGGHSGKIVLTV